MERIIPFLISALFLWTVQSSFGLDLTSISPKIDQYRKLERTLQLLGGRRSDKPNTLRILLLGQTMSDASWFTNLAASIQESYPSTVVQAEYRGVDNHLAEHLLQYAEAEVYPNRPDLIIYFAQGRADAIRKQVSEIRRRTSADIILINNPPRLSDDLKEEDDPRKIMPDAKAFQITEQNFPQWLNYIWVPKVAEEFDAAFINMRTALRSRLVENQLQVSEILSDNTHFTRTGHRWMSEIVKQWFEISAGAMPYDVWDNKRVLTYRNGRDLKWKDNELRFEFTGNRIEMVTRDRVTTDVQIEIDGAKPLQIPGLRIAGRASNLPGTRWPALLRIGALEPLLGETWRLKTERITKSEDGKVKFQFRLTGSITGDDGEGSSEFDFLSKSHRVEIRSADWNLTYITQVLGAALPEQIEVTWSEIDLAKDSLGPDSEIAETVGRNIPIAVGLKNGKHSLRITLGKGGKPEWLESIRVYRPVLN